MCLDPPFNSKRNYNLLFKSPKGNDSEAQITAFGDSWHWAEQAELEFDELLSSRNTDVAEMIMALRAFPRENDMMAYLTMMANCLLDLHRVLKLTGSLYLHCDPKASHYLRILLDAVFEKTNLRNEIVWKRTSSHGNVDRGYGDNTDGPAAMKMKSNLFGVYEMLSDRFLRYIFRRYYRQRMTEMVAPDFPILLDYPVKCSARYGYGKPPHRQLFAILEARRNEYAKRLSRFCLLRDSLSQIPDESTLEGVEPCWGPQRYFSTLDAVALYGMLFEFRPKRFLEVGSGYSTKFARRAIHDHSLRTRVTSIDPAPRAEIDKLCDSVIRRPLEELDLSIFDELEPGDFLFIDSSHRAFSNSDVTVAFMDVLPRLKAGVVVHFHDIFWPYDYYAEWADRYYSEQYLLGSYLLGDGASKVKVLLPNAFVVRDPELARICKPLLEIAGIRRPCNAIYSPYGIGGSSFWLQLGTKENG